MVLPLKIKDTTVISQADSGYEENVIAAALADLLQVDIDRGLEHQKLFRIANGKLVKALGRITVT